jgi:hypothetical protein
MESEVKQSENHISKSAIYISMSLQGIPEAVHAKILKYRARLVGRKERSFTVKEAYVEFLKEASKTIR